MHITESPNREQHELKISLVAAYKRLTTSDLLLFLNLRCLPTEGTFLELVNRLADNDILLFGETIQNRPSTFKPGPTKQRTGGLPNGPLPYPTSLSPKASRPELYSHNSNSFNSPPPNSQVLNATNLSHPCRMTSRLPSELWVTILEFLNDWELSMSLGLPTYMQKPSEWGKATSVDYTILTGSITEVQRVLAENPTDGELLDNIRNGSVKIGPNASRTVSQALKFSEIGGNVMCRFGFTNLLSYFWNQNRAYFLSVLGDISIPYKASVYNKPRVLDWWFNHSTAISRGSDGNSDPATTFHRSYKEDAVDSASRNGHIEILNWWKSSGLEMLYSEASLEGASVRGHVNILQWWKESHLPLKIGRVMDLASLVGNVNVLDWWLKSGLSYTYDKALYNASCYGRVNVLDWWLGSGLRLVYDNQALVAATLHNKPEVLDWWKNSGLPIEYRICDIEEALEDAVGAGDGARKWWMAQAVNFRASNKEWAETKVLNKEGSNIYV